MIRTKMITRTVPMIDVNILLPNGDYYRQGLEGNTLFFPNPVGNINDKKF